MLKRRMVISVMVVLFVGSNIIFPALCLQTSKSILSSGVISYPLDEYLMKGLTGVFYERFWSLSEARADWVRKMEICKDMGVEVIRVDLEWDTIQPSEGTWDWSHFDQMMDIAAQYGFKVYPILSTAPSWASPTWKFVPEDRIPDWIIYVQEVVKRYDDRVIGYEIWNEADLTEFWTGTPEQFALVHNAAYDAIKPLSDKPVCLDISGIAFEGAAPEEMMLETWLNYGIKMDVLSQHVYCANRAPDGEWSRYNKVPDLRAWMDAHGLAEVPIWLTEFGWRTDQPAAPPGPITEQDKANYITRAWEMALEWQKQGIIHGLWSPYELIDKKTPSEPDNSGLGFLYNDWTKKPAYDAYKGLTHV